YSKVVLSAWSGPGQIPFEDHIYTEIGQLEANNDFVILDNSSNYMIIDPLANDPSDHSSTHLRSINSVKYGAATIENGKISYYKSSQATSDIIHYTISDDNGNSDDALVYLLQENYGIQGNKVFDYTLTNESSRYLILSHSNFSLISGTNSGKLTKIHDLVYEYTPNPGFIGELSIVYKDIAQNMVQFNLDVVRSEEHTSELQSRENL